jgi:hypothetical protein
MEEALVILEKLGGAEFNCGEGKSCAVIPIGAPSIKPPQTAMGEIKSQSAALKASQHKD